MIVVLPSNINELGNQKNVGLGSLSFFCEF